MTETVLIHTDGAARGNPGPAAAGGVVYLDGTIVAEVSDYLGTQTNNWAEYEGLLRALVAAHRAIGPGLADMEVTVKMDSELIVKQLNGEYRVKEPALREQYERVQTFLVDHRLSVTFEHVRREANKEADRLCNEALDAHR